VWETELVDNLVVMLEGIVIGEGRDESGWRPEGGGCFSANPCYKQLERLFLLDGNLSEN